jgi:hypothetical protein
MKLDQQTFQRWTTWCERIKEDLMQLINDKQIHDYFIEVANANLGTLKQMKEFYFVILLGNVTAFRRRLESDVILSPVTVASH